PSSPPKVSAVPTSGFSMPIMPIYFYTRARLVHPSVNYVTTALDNFPWKYLDITATTATAKR
ncbi:MAG: hypothetical protein L0271_27865, partial [Gemmatimonadetes bacterium]|nr:hypothetical protein [Gemmatimonadota bacterium]